jgi:membrane protein DedA with SNARE-associated domain
MLNFFAAYLADPLTDVIETFVTHSGTIAPILLIILEEAGIPLPVPGDFIIAYTGYQVTIGAISYIAAFILILISVLIGASFLFYLSRRFGQKIVTKFGRLMHLDTKKIALVEDNFKKYGPIVIIFGRHVPGFRIPVTVFSGISKISYKTFLISTFISVILWIPLYLGVGQRLGVKTVQLFRGHHLYFLIVLIPFILFVGSLIYIYLKPNEKKHKTK